MIQKASEHGYMCTDRDCSIAIICKCWQCEQAEVLTVPPQLSADGLCGALFIQHMATQPSADTAHGHHLLLHWRLWSALWASQKRAGSTSCQGVRGPVRPCKSWGNLPLAPLHTNCSSTASVTNRNIQLAQGRAPGQLECSSSPRDGSTAEMVTKPWQGLQPGVTTATAELDVPCWQCSSLWSVTTDSTEGYKGTLKS